MKMTKPHHAIPGNVSVQSSAPRAMIGTKDKSLFNDERCEECTTGHVVNITEFLQPSFQGAESRKMRRLHRRIPWFVGIAFAVALAAVLLRKEEQPLSAPPPSVERPFPEDACPVRFTIRQDFEPRRIDVFERGELSKRWYELPAGYRIVDISSLQ